MVFLALTFLVIFLCGIARVARVMSPRYQFEQPKRTKKEKNKWVAEAKVGFWRNWVSIGKNGEVDPSYKLTTYDTRTKAKWAIQTFNDRQFEKCGSMEEYEGETFEERKSKQLSERIEEAFKCNKEKPHDKEQVLLQAARNFEKEND